MSKITPFERQMDAARQRNSQELAALVREFQQTSLAQRQLRERITELIPATQYPYYYDPGFSSETDGLSPVYIGPDVNHKKIVILTGPNAEKAANQMHFDRRRHLCRKNLSTCKVTSKAPGHKQEEE